MTTEVPTQYEYCEVLLANELASALTEAELRSEAREYPNLSGCELTSFFDANVTDWSTHVNSLTHQLLMEYQDSVFKIAKEELDWVEYICNKDMPVETWELAYELLNINWPVKDN